MRPTGAYSSLYTPSSYYGSMGYSSLDHYENMRPTGAYSS